MNFPEGLKPGDLIILILSVLLTLGSFLYAAGSNSGTPRVEIETPSGRFVYTLDKPEEVEIPGSLGPSLIKINASGVEFLASPCFNKLCIHQGLQDQPGDWAACLPNKVFVRMLGQPSPGGPDAGTY